MKATRVTTETIKNCFVKYGFSKLESDGDETDEEYLGIFLQNIQQKPYNGYRESHFDAKVINRISPFPKQPPEVFCKKRCS